MFGDSQPSDIPQVPEGAAPVESPSGKIIGWTKTQIVRNGSARRYDVVWSPLVKAIVVFLLSLSGTGIISTVAMYRELGTLSAKLESAQSQIERAANETLTWPQRVRRYYTAWN